MVRFFSKKPDDTSRRRRVDIAERASESSLEQRYTFRRNRTITGSASSKVSALSESKAQIKSPRVQAHTLVRQRRHIGLILSVVVVIASCLYGLISQFTSKVVVVATPDSSLRLDATYEKTIQTYLSGQSIERLRFMIDSGHLTDYIQAAEPEVKAVHVDGSAGFGISRFAIEMRTPIAGWSINGHQQYVDASGAAFSRNYFPSPSVQVVDKSGVQATAGQAIASNRFLGFVGQVVGLSQARGYAVNQVIIPSGTTRQIELQVKDINYPIKLSIDRPAGEQVEDMARAITWMSANHQTIEYLDVRVSGKAYYR